MSKQDDFLIILDPVPTERQAETALFLSGCFSLPTSSTKGIAASGPIALLADLPRNRAESILEEMRASLPSGVSLRIVSGDEAGKLARLQWPRQPRVYGRELSEYGDITNSEISCPHCGELIRVARDGSGLKAVPVRDSKRSRISDRGQLDHENGDPLFSGVKPLVGADSNYASLRSLEAGDTGFWMDYGNKDPYSPAAPVEHPSESPLAKDSTHDRKGSGRSAAGLAAFMKPGGFALVIGRTRDSQTVKMIAEIMGISEGEARDKCLNLGVCVAKDISLDEAQNLLARFRNLGAKARIVRPS